MWENLGIECKLVYRISEKKEAKKKKKYLETTTINQL